MEIIMKLPLYFYKFKKKMKILTLSLCISVSVFLGDAMPSYASSYEDLMEAMENRKSLPVQSNEIENWPDGPLIGAEAAIVVEANTGVILYSKNIHEKLYPASTTKILTCLIATENSSLDEIVSFSSNAVFSIEKGSSNMGMDVGQSITMEECLYGILVGSANEVANAVAEHIGGSTEGFAEMMNQKASELGCLDSHFANANGLHNDDHYTSAYDLSVIAREFFQNELLAKISGTPTQHFEPSENQPDDFILRTHHKLVTQDYTYEGIIGGKTGYTDKARQTLVTCAERNGMKLICVVMKEESPNQFTDTIDLLNYGFNNFEVVNVSENETKFNINNADFFQSNNDIFGSSKPILSLNKDSYLILPKTAVFKDTVSSISYDVEDENQIARIDYTYNDIYVGNASVDIAADVSSSYDFDSSIEETPKKVEEDTEENVIFVNIKKILLFVLIGAGILILLFIMKSLLQNYSFSKGHRRTRLRRRRKDKWPTYKFSDKDWKI
jgi:D-alanyl-D-alanine carboxypeptidase (penicillin-binding protein 5/6)